MNIANTAASLAAALLLTLGPTTARLAAQPAHHHHCAAPGQNTGLSPNACQWQGRTVAILGDSISDEGQIEWFNNTWWNHLADILGIEPHAYAVSGQKMADIIPQAERMEAGLGDHLDAILILIGTNDFNAAIPMGEFYTYSKETLRLNSTITSERTRRTLILDDSTFRGRCNKALSHLRTRYPDKQIILLTPPHRGYANFGGEEPIQPGEDYSNSIGLFLEDYVQAIREAAQIWSVPVIDLYNISGLTPLVEEQGGYFRKPDTDRLHPNQRGQLRMAQTIAYQLQALPAAFPKYVALSFDDGPNTVTTPKMLDLLEKHGVRASFFVIGQNIKGDAIAVMQRAATMGCDIQNHSYTHGFMSKMTEKQIREEVEKTSALIEHYAGRTPTLFRPPYIDHNELMHNTIDLTFVCGLGSNDWEPSCPAEERARLILDNVRDGDLLLLHDFEGNDATIEALETVIPELKKRGFVFVTVPELFEIRGAMPAAHNGRVYTNIFD